MSDSVRRVGPTKEQLSELKTTRAYKLAKEKMVTTMSDNKTTSNDNDLLSNPREHDHLGHYDQPTEDSEQIVSQTIDEKRSTVDNLDESTHLRLENLRQVDIEAIAPEPPFVTIHFYANDPDSMRRLRLCLRAEAMHSVLWELVHNVIPNEMEYGCDDHNGEVAYNTLDWVLKCIDEEMEDRGIRWEE